MFELNCCHGAFYQCADCNARLNPLESRNRMRRMARARGYGGVLRAMSPRKPETVKAAHHG